MVVAAAGVGIAVTAMAAGRVAMAVATGAAMEALMAVLKDAVEGAAVRTRWLNAPQVAGFGMQPVAFA